MKKILSLTLTIVMVFALCLTASAGEFNCSFDRLFINGTTLTDGGENYAEKESVTIAVGDKLYILAWAVMDSGLKEVVYTINGGADVACADNYRARPDLATAGISADNDDYSKAGIGKDDAAFELVGIDKLTDGTYTLQIVCIANDGTRYDFKDAKTLVVGTGVNAGGDVTPPATSDAAVVVVAAIAAIALACVVVVKKVRA